MRAIGIDVGGTAIKFALVSDGEVLLRAQCPTPTGDPPALAKAAAALIRENAPDWEMLPIGFACAGDVDPKTGLVSADNLGWQNVPLGSLLREALGRDVLLEQDTHAAMMAEWANGSLKGEKNALYLTIGTGVGGGAILDGRPYREIRRPGSEFGHMITHAPVGKEAAMSATPPPPHWFAGRKATKTPKRSWTPSRETTRRSSPSGKATSKRSA